jgi:membrane fusion protein, multidrug efflux system
VAARVSGLVEEAPFQEGAIVQKGAPLFLIDPRPFQADLDSKKAAVAQAQAQADQALVHLNRYKAVRNTKAISADDYDAAQASYAVAEATLAAAVAAQETAALNLQWTRVTAPITGRISRKFVQAGNLVNGGNGQATLLTTIVSIDPIYCYVDIPERAALRYKQLAAQTKHDNIARAKIPCFLQVQGELNYSHPGVIDFVDNQIDTGTGTVQIRGIFPNPRGILTPGLFVRMRVEGSSPHPALLVPAAAVGADQNEQFLLIVGNDNVVQRRNVEFGPTFGTLRSITSGLHPDERVIVNGLQMAMPGSKVKPHEAPIPGESLRALDAVAPASPTTQEQPESQPATQPSARAHGTGYQPVAAVVRGVGPYSGRVSTSEAILSFETKDRCAVADLAGVPANVPAYLDTRAGSPCHRGDAR